MSKKTGKAYGKRTLAVEEDGLMKNGNQWEATQRQQNWLKYYMDPREKETWGNAYQAALKAGYSEGYAARIMSDSMAVQWVRQAKNIMRLNPEHLKAALQDIIGDKGEKTSDRLQAIKMLGMDQGMFVQKTINTHVGWEEALNSLE